jgi:hypothetical protein
MTLRGISNLQYEEKSYGGAFGYPSPTKYTGSLTQYESAGKSCKISINVDKEDLPKYKGELETFVDIFLLQIDLIKTQIAKNIIHDSTFSNSDGSLYTVETLPQVLELYSLNLFPKKEKHSVYAEAWFRTNEQVYLGGMIYDKDIQVRLHEDATIAEWNFVG